MFDGFVSGTRPSWRRRGVLIASLGFHGAAAIALLILSFFHVAEIAPPPLAITFVSAAPPPPGGEPATAATPAKRAHPRPHPVAAHAPLVQPTPTATPSEPVDTAPDNDASDDSNDNDSDGKGGGPGGPGHGPGTPGGTGTGPSTPSVAARPINVAPHKLDAQRLFGSDPHLPQPMIHQHAGERGLTFIARMCVDQSGRVAQISVVQSLPGADAEIVSELRRWRYQPQPIPVCFMTNFVFDVERN